MLNHDVMILQVKSEFHSVQEIQRREEGGERDKTLKHDHIGYIYIDNNGCLCLKEAWDCGSCSFSNREDFLCLVGRPAGTKVTLQLFSLSKKQT